MMAGDVYLPYHNDLIPEDTNQDYSISALDALVVINAINAGQLGGLSSPGVGKADGPMLDVSGDNALSPLDALRVINRINGEGEVGDLVGFTLKLADQNGNDLTSNQVSVGQTFLLKAYVQDLRGFNAKGVFGAYMDLDYTNGGKFQVQVGETQSFRYFYDKISTTDTTSAFIFKFGSETTAPVSLFNGSSPRSADQMAAAIQAALEALPSIGAGNVVVRRDPVASAQDSADGIQRNSYDIQFINALAGKDVPLLTLDASNVKVQPGQTFQYTLTDKSPADPTDPESFASAFRFADEFSSGRTATQGTSQFDEVGAFSGLGSPTDTTQPHLLFTVPLKAVMEGTVTFAASPADVFPAHDTLVFPKDTVPTDLIDYGSPLTVQIASNLVANADSFTLAEDAASTQLNVTSNDQLFSGSSFTITTVGASSEGVTPTISSDGKKVNYQPKANFFGTDTFTYTIKNNLGDTSTATVTVTVTPVNDPISVPNQTATTNLGKAIVLTTEQLTAGGSVGAGEDGIQQLSIASVVSPSTKGGTVSLSNGSVTYTPATGFAGTDTFVVVATDNGQTNGVADPKTQSVTVTVTVTNDAPVATNDTVTVDEASSDNSLDVLANDNAGANDVNDSLKVTAVGSAQHGTVTISSDKKTVLYTPAVDYVGSDSFTYTVTDLGGATAVATVSVTVEPTALPRARADVANTTEDDTNGVLIDVLANDRVEVGSAPVLVGLGNVAAAHGTVTIDDNGTPEKTDDKLRYVPNANFSGQDTFTYILDEDVQGSIYSGPSEGTVTVNVAAVNDAPVIADDTASTSEDTAVTISATTLLGNDSPGAGEDAQQTLSITGVQAVTAGAGSVTLAGGNVVYTPAANFNGSFVFTYTATDNGTPALSGTATVTVTVSAVNDAPVAANDTVSAVEDTAKTIAAADLLGNDKPGPDSAADEAGQTLTIVAVGSSANGATVTLAGDGSSIAYTPALNFFGTDTFTYTVRDNGNPALETTATATINVSAVNDAPTAANDTVTAFKGVPLTIVGTSLLANDRPGPANESTQTLKITSVSGATNGSVQLLANGDVVFTPVDGYTGPAEFTYTVSDNGQTGGADDFQTASATVAVDVKDFIPSTLSGTLWVDETHDRIINMLERRLGDVVVKLTGTSFGLPVARTAVTDADGHYEFGLLAPGSYTVSYVTPALLLDGADVPGSLGDNDGKSNNNSMSFTIGGIGGANASGYNFAVNGVNASYGVLLEQLASSYYAASGQQASKGMYATLGANGAQNAFFNLDGFDDIMFAEATMSADGRQVVLTVVDGDHSVHSAVLGRGKFIALQDNAGNTIIRILGGRDQLPFQEVNMEAPTISAMSTQPKHYLEAVDQFFDQEGF